MKSNCFYWSLLATFAQKKLGPNKFKSSNEGINLKNIKNPEKMLGILNSRFFDETSAAQLFFQEKAMNKSCCKRRWFLLQPLHVAQTIWLYVGILIYRILKVIQKGPNCLPFLCRWQTILKRFRAHKVMPILEGLLGRNWHVVKLFSWPSSYLMSNIVCLVAPKMPSILNIYCKYIHLNYRSPPLKGAVHPWRKT